MSSDRPTVAERAAREVRHPLAITRDGTSYLLVTAGADEEQLHDGRRALHCSATYIDADALTVVDRRIHGHLAARQHRIAAAADDVLAAMHRLAAAVAATADRHGLRSTGTLLGVSHDTARRWSTPDGIAGSAQVRSLLASVERNGAPDDA